MHWGSFDPFLTEDAFWQDRMGMPVANKEFLRALLEYGTFESYHFFCDDVYQIGQLHKMLDQSIPAAYQKRVKVSVQGLFFEEFRKTPLDVMHHGDFTTFLPYLMELRNGMSSSSPPFPVTGVTHALDTVKLHTSFIQLLLARPKPFDAIVCTSRCAVEMLRKAFEHIRGLFDSLYQAKLPSPPSLVQIPLGISKEMFQPQDRTQCRLKLGIPANHFVMLSLGRFSPRRKMDLAPLLECVSWLKTRSDGSKLPPFTLILAGAGRTPDIKLAHDMLAQVGLQQDVRIEGNVTFEMKRLLYGAADIFLSLVDNYQETFGLSIIEAMAQGLPVIASDFNGYKELVAHGRTGFLIPTYASMSQEPWDSLMGLLNFSMLRLYRAQKVAFDVAELGEALMKLALYPDLRREMALRARTRATPYQWPLIIPFYEELWKHQGEEARHWMAASHGSERTPPLLIPSTPTYFSHYPTHCLRPETTVRLSSYGIERCKTGFRPILYEEMTILLHEEYLNFLTSCLSQKEWSLAELLDECQSRFGAVKEMLLLQLDWLIKHGYVDIER